VDVKNLRKKLKRKRSKFDFSKTFDLFKTTEQTEKQIDIYPLLFKTALKTIKLRNYFFYASSYFVCRI